MSALLPSDEGVEAAAKAMLDWVYGPMLPADDLRLMDEYRARARVAIAAWNRRAAPVGDALLASAKTGWNACRRSIYAVCEDVGIEPDKAASIEGEHAKGYAAGMARAAKSIARGFNAMDAEDDDNFTKALAELPAPFLPSREDVARVIDPEDDVWSADKSEPRVIRERAVARQDAALAKASAILALMGQSGDGDAS